MTGKERTPIIASIDTSVFCTVCGVKGVNNCDCWEDCTCGRVRQKGHHCTNTDCWQSYLL